MKIKIHLLILLALMVLLVVAQPPRRFVIDAHHHYSSSPDYLARLVKVYRARNAMACVLTPMAGFEVVKKAAEQVV